MKKLVVIMLCVGLLVLILAGCASSIANLLRETARCIGDISPDQVIISNVVRGMTGLTW